MGRHSHLPDGTAGPSHIEPPRARRSARRPGTSRHEGRGPGRRGVAIATALVLVLGAGGAVAAYTGALPFAGGCDRGSVGLRVAASPDIAPALRAVADRARRQHVMSDEQCLDVHVSARTGEEMAAGAAHRRHSPFQVWIPDSSLWTERAEAGAGGLSLESEGNVASSPVTLAAVPAAARKLGWPHRSYGWGDIASAATRDDSLAIGSADPARSATGLLALTRIQESSGGGPDTGAPDAAAGGGDAGGHAKKAKDGGKAEGGGSPRIAAAAQLLAQRTAPGDAQILATLPHDDSGAELGNPRRNQSLIVSEQAAYHYNVHRGAGPALRLLYPEDGLTFLDYPYMLLNGQHLATRTNRAATRFQTLLGAAEGRRALADRGFRAAAGHAEAAVTRRAGGRAPQPYDDPAADPPSAHSLRSALGVWTVAVQSARLTLVVDASASMGDGVPGRSGHSRMDVTKNALLRGLSRFTADDEIGLWEFATRLKGGKDYRKLVPTARLGSDSGDGTTQRDRLSAAFGALQPVPGGATGLYDTALAAYKDARSSYSEGEFNAVVLLTDGSNEDPGSISRHELTGKLKQLAAHRHLPLIAVAVGPDADLDSCREIAEATGGSAHRVDDPSQIYSVILKAGVAAGSAGARTVEAGGAS